MLLPIYWWGNEAQSVTCPGSSGSSKWGSSDLKPGGLTPESRLWLSQTPVSPLCKVDMWQEPQEFIELKKTECAIRAQGNTKEFWGFPWLEKRPLPTRDFFFLSGIIWASGLLWWIKNIKTCHLVDGVYSSFPRHNKAAKHQKTLKRNAGGSQAASLFSILDFLPLYLPLSSYVRTIVHMCEATDWSKPQQNIPSWNHIFLCSFNPSAGARVGESDYQHSDLVNSICCYTSDLVSFFGMFLSGHGS